MTRDEAYAILQEPKKKRQLIESCMTEISSLRELSVSLKSFSYDREKVKGSSGSANANFVLVVEKILNKEEQLWSVVDSYIESYNAAELLISRLSSDLSKAVLRNTYLLFLSDREIGQILHFSERHIRRIRGSAVEYLTRCP